MTERIIDGLAATRRTPKFAADNYPKRMVVERIEVPVGDPSHEKPFTVSMVLLDCGHKRRSPKYQIRGQAPIEQTPILEGETLLPCRACYDKNLREGE